MKRRELIASLAVVSVLPSSVFGNPWAEFADKIREVMSETAAFDNRLYNLMNIAADRGLISDWITHRGMTGAINAVSVVASSKTRITWFRREQERRIHEWMSRLPGRQMENIYVAV